jgi:hypothetical protein
MIAGESCVIIHSLECGELTEASYAQARILLPLGEEAAKGQ